MLRINGQNLLLPGESRNHEVKIWQAASRAGIAPPLLFSDEQAGFLVNSYIDSDLPANRVENVDLANQALDLLISSHQLQIKTPAIDYAKHIARYWSVIESNNTPINPTLTTQRVPMQLVLKTLLNSAPATDLCHHDPVVANFVGNSERLYLIDWEYAANGLQVMDYAAFGIEWGLDDEIIVKRSGVDAQILVLAKTLYLYICSLWEAQMDPGASPG